MSSASQGFFMSSDAVTSLVQQKIIQASELYNRLVVFVAPSGSGKTRVLQDVHLLVNAPLINVNLELSRRMLELTQRQRTLQLSRLLGDIIESSLSDVVLLDNIEILFDLSLKQDPLRLLLALSRKQTIVVSWSGSVESNYLTYALPEHPEYRKYTAKDFLVVMPDSNS